MALFMLERSFAASLDPSAEERGAIVDINTIVGVKWLYSFLSADKRKTYCLYEAEEGDAIREAARRAGLPVDVIVELSGELRPDGFFAFDRLPPPSAQDSTADKVSLGVTSATRA